MGWIKGEGETEDSYKISKIAAHVPDLVVYSTLTNDIPYAENFHGVLLFADVSGFTNLTEKFSLSSKKGYGADELTRTLNSYIGEIVSHILDAGGDILNYAGDAILALWTVERIQLSEVISLVVKCSLNIQDQCGVRETEVGCQLKVKIGISAGKLSKVIVGDEISQYFVVIGRAVDEVRLAEGLAVASTIILSPNAWELCERDNIAIDPIENERAVKVRYIKREPRFSVEKYQESIGTHVEHENVTRDCVRKASRLMPNAELERTFRKYIMKTVLQKIDDDQPLEYLSEMRPATIVFVNMQFKGGESDQEQCMTIHQAAIGIGQQIVKHHGRVNKVFMFDKGCTFLCLFGLPGDKREDESAHALQAAYGVHDLCQKEIRSLKTVSVGVTTGPVFCGVVGHPVRHEYTVIGRKVNLAARLMMHYPGMVSCDSETCYYSKLPAFYFNELPKKAMKGVKNPGALYQFMANKHQITVGKAPMSVEREEGYPLLGREKEIEVYSSVLKGFLEARAAGHKNYNNVLIYEGPIGYGKSRLLAEVVYRTAKDGVRVISFELAKTDIKQSNYALQTLLAIVMSVQNCKSYAERERVLLSKILDSKMRQNLCLLNDILLVKFPVSKDVSLMDSQTKNKKMRNYFLELFCKFAEEEPCVYVLDQAHFVDQASWAFLLEACKRASVLLCMALLPHTSQSGSFPELSRIIKDPRTLYLNLPGLEPPVIAQLACQILGVVRIPSEVELFLVERSHGVPYYCEELLKSLYLGNLIVMEEVEEEDEAKDIDILFPEPTLVVHCSKPSQVWQEEDARAGALGPPKASMLKSRKITALDHFVDRTLVCFVGEAAKFHEVPIPLTLKGMALAHLDHLQPADQMVVKCAAIIGHTITTQMLINILPESENHDKLNLSLTSLFKSGTFECGSKPKQFTQQLTKESECWGALNCYCVQDSQEDIREEVSGKASVDGVWRCRVMRFCTALVKETAYELWLKEQKREIHQKCASYLLKQAHRCRDCGIAEFIFGHKAAIGNNLIEIHPSLLNIQESGEALFLGQSTLGLPKETIQLNQVSPLHPNSEEDEFLLKLDSRVDEYKTTVDRSRKCRCAQVMECVLCPMVRHCTGVGDVPKTFYYLLETAAASAFLSNNLKALSYLNEAKIILDNLKVGKPAFETADPKVKVKINNFERACVFRLRGEVLYNTGQMEEAESMFASALRLLNRRLPTNRVAVSLKYVCEKMKSLCCRSKNFDNPGEKKLAFLHEQVCCLSYMWQIGCMRRAPKDMLNASLAITMEMNSAQRTAEENKIIFSCIDYLQYCQLSGLDDQCKSYERMLCGNFVELSDCMEGLTLTSYFIRTLSIVKLCSGALHDSIQYGLRAEKISKLTNRRGPDMLVITVLYTPLLLTQRYEECVQLMQSLEYQGNRTRIITAKGWFYVGCFDFLLYSGFAFRPFEECYTFVEESQSDPNLVADKSLMMNLYSALALWYARLCEWEKACFFYTKACGVTQQAPSSIHSINGVVMFLECHVLLFRKALVEHNQHIKAIYQSTQKHFTEFNRKYSTNKMYAPRVLHLRAYMYLLAGHEALATAILNKAVMLCQQHGNKLEESWIAQNQISWFGVFRQSTSDWFASTLTMPSWEEAKGMDPEELTHTRYTLMGVGSEIWADNSSLYLAPKAEDTQLLKGQG
ncbi:LOW QUALITY PROTEIN: adenylate cyclase type 10-like [Coregonus clupeaformis]|uniref:LOW QUALITY PROTEIN: adenylate cyclase type 10-like n=1 Tax=Coregonus clupeaformis TaxID=59861 RepID=UPI001E1C5CCA|nr:LOW QUALITY PROTEIN: adenylate cyclase type 10-like [Coregonus clupeaformis]